MQVATLVGAPGAGTLFPALADRAAAAARASAVYFLADGEACDLPLSDRMGGEEARVAIIDALDGAPLDVVVQEQDTRRHRLLLADMDSTVIEQECIDELAAEAGLGERVAAITARAMAGEVDFDGALRERVALLQGLPASVIDKVLRERIREASGARTLVATMRAHGARCALVSGGFTAFTQAVAARLGFHEHRANVLEIADGRLTGRVREPILGRDAKVAALREIAAAHGLTPADALAVGDGANDLGMIAAAGTGVALHAKPAVAAAAPHRIDHGDLSALLYLQGYRRSDFAPTDLA